MFNKVSPLKLALAFTISSFSQLNGQALFSYDFEGAAKDPWPAEWSTNSLGHGGNLNTPKFQLRSPQEGVIEAPFAEETGGTMRTSPTIGDMRMTSVYTPQSFDLSSTNSSMKITQWWLPGTPQAGRGQPVATGVNQLFQIGLLADTGSVFSDSSAHSVWLGGLETSHNITAKTTTLNLGGWNETGLQQTTNTALNVAMVNGFENYLYEVELTFIQSGNGTFQMLYDIAQWEHVTHPTLNTRVMSAVDLTFASGTGTIAHNFSKQELSSLYVGLGANIEDINNASISGTTYDAPATTIVPEPSSVLLISFITPLLILRRRR